MTQAVTLQIMRVAPDHDLSYDVQKQARRYRLGDIIQVLDTAKYATKNGNNWQWNEPISNPRMVFIHMDNVPDDRAVNMKEKLACRARRNDDNNGDDEPIRRRRWCFDIAGLTAELDANREATMEWTVARERIRKKQIVTELDADADDVTQAIQDSDLPG